MSKLHELLAVDANLKGQSEKTRKELMNTFEKKRHLFTEKKVTFQPLDEGAEQVVEEQLDLQSTVVKELDWVSEFLGNAIDTSYSIAEANTYAKADVVLENGTTLLKDVPATYLLELEKRVREIQELILTVPTLDPAKGFSLDPDRGKDIYKARDDKRPRTKKTSQALVLYEATDKHPAQVKELVIDVPTGTILTQEWSGLITPAQKAALLAKVESLLRSVKKARSRANDVEVVQSKNVSKSILDFILKG